MSSVLHPVGPEPRERYWVRRVAVLVAAVVVIAVVIALVGNAMSAGSAVQAEPAPPSVVLPTVATTPSVSPTPATSGSPTPGATPGAATPSAGSSASPTAGGSATSGSDRAPTSEPSSSADTKKAAEKAAQKKADDKKAAEKKKAAEEQKKKAATLAPCPTGDVRATLTGPRKVKTGKEVTFDLSLINGSSSTCSVKASSDNFTLTVVSGRDRIWSSGDCAKSMPAQSKKLAAQKSVDWSMTWDGARSAARCKSRPESPKPGYYWAIASFDGAKEVRWRIILT